MAYNKKHQIDYYRRNIEEIKEKRRKYYLLNKKAFRKRQLKYKEKGLTVKWAKEWVKNHKEKVRIQSNEWRRQRRQRVIEKLGGKCIICGHNNTRHLETDRIKGGRHSTSYVFTHTEEFQILCANHHSEKTLYGSIIYEGKEYIF